MKPDFDQVIAAFNLVLDHTLEIEELRKQDPELCQEVEKLLRQSKGTWNFGQNEQSLDTMTELVQERYRLDRQLGRGGFGIVYLAYDERLHRKPVVVKFLTRTPRGDEWFRKKFEDEIAALARIDHPGVVGILDAGETNRGTPFLVMQYAEGVSLRALIVPGGIDAVRSAGIIRQIGQALSAAHASGVLHRDLKPENIIVQETSQGEVVRLIDFGIASVRTDLESAGDTTRVVGTPYYMAPEQMRGHPSAASDIFAMAVIAWEMLFGENPFGEKGLSVREEPLEPAVAIIRKSLSQEPADRYQNAAMFADKLARALEKDQGSAAVTASLQDAPSPVMFKGGEVLCDRFRIERLLGVGGMGEVYEAMDTVLRERVALKTIRLDGIADERMKARFEQEVYAARKIAHPNICRIHDLHRHEKIAFLTMELVEGETLQARLRRTGPMNLEDARLIAQQLAAALTAAHGAGVIHRDFKTANVILAASADRAVVMDFGLARSLQTKDRADSLTETGRAVGTPAYMAPEQLMGGPITPAVDIYAFGVVLYELVTGTHPLGERFVSPKVRRPDLPVEWESAILGCLERQPENRTARAEDVWAGIAGESKRSAASAVAGNPRARMAGAVGFGVVLLVGVLTGLWFLGRHRPPEQALRWYDEGTRALRDGLSFTAMKALETAVQMDGEFTLAHARLAEAATELDYMDKAKSEMLRATPPAFQSFFLSKEEKLRLEAVYLTLMKDFPKAAEKYKELAEKVGTNERPAVLVDLGRVYESGGKIPEALASYSESAAADRQFAAAFLRRGILEGKQQQTAKATEDFDAAEQLYRTAGKSEGLTEVLIQRSSLLRRSGKLAEARVPTEKGLEMARATGDDYHQIRALLALSYLSYNSGATELGGQQAQQAIDLARRAGIEVLAASGLVDLGGALFSKGDNAAAEPYFRDAIEAATRFQAVRVAARAELPLGQLLSNEGRTAEALAISKKAVEDFQKAGEKGNAARAMIPFFKLVRDQGDYESASNLYRQQLESAEKVNDEGGVAFAAQGLGSVQLLQEKYLAALASFDRSVAVSHAVGNQSVEGYSYMSRADALGRLGRYQEAVESLKSAEVLAEKLGGNKPLRASINRSRAELDLSQRRFREAEQDVQVELKDAGQSPAAVAMAKRRLGLIRLMTGRAREGLVICEESVREAEKTTSKALLKDSELALAEAKLATGDLLQAINLATAGAEYFAGKGQLESQFYALSLAAAAKKGDDRTKYLSAASKAWDQLRQDLGQESFKIYSTRPDIQIILQRNGLTFGIR